MSKKPRPLKILLLDIESLPNIVTSWRVGYNINLDYENILQERRILCVSWKWWGAPSNELPQTLLARPTGAKRFLSSLWRVLQQADIVVAHNGDRFDIPYIKTQGIHYGLKPLPPFKTIDTLKIARKHFYFNSNRLDYLGQYLGVGRKIKTDYGLWRKCLDGDKKALSKMVAYNKQDVLLLEKVFERLKPYVNQKLFTAPHQCPTCGSTCTQKRGKYRTASNEYSRLVCTFCGKWFRDSRPIQKVTKGNTVPL